MTSDYADIFTRFYLSVKDYEMAGMTEKLATEILNGYLRQTISKPMVRRLFASIKADDDVEEVEYEMREPLDDDSDKDFVEEVLSVGMLEQWALPRYNSTLLTSQMFNNSESRFYSQSAHLAEVKELLTKAQNDLRKLIRDRGYSNAVINGVDAT